MDNRRQPFVAIDVWFLYSTTNERLMDRFGPVGPLAWIGLLAAAKRAPHQGTLTCLNETDFWDQVGIPAAHHPSMDDFLKLLGSLKQTSRTRSGRRLNVRISQFERWQKLPRNFREAERMSRKRAQTTANGTATIEREYSGDTATERRGEDASTSTYGITRADSKPSPAYAEGYGDDLRDGTTAETYVAQEGWTLTPGALAVELLERWPELDDPAIQHLVKIGDTISREYAALEPDPEEAHT